MNRTHWEHAIIAALMMLIVWAILALFDIPGAALIAFVIPVTWFVAREATQHEYKLGTQRGWRWGRNLPVKWWEGVVRGWSRDSLLDWLAPLFLCLALLIALQLSPLPI
ncbi:MAG: hypothetical protein CMN25_08515 [Salinicola sp.]|uniref:hypothetical protein n=1 Tax=uncultured Salinicola sp. TaxID=1193542 RepID=UPI000C911723|nr:hypothetical protein [uncultured Salinicola sp.]MAM57362.1 hypothetical protein [Salinicola sp.]